MPFLFVLLLSIAGLAGCASEPVVSPQDLPATPAAFKEGNGLWTVAPPAEAQPRGTWWKVFSDPTLDDLVERAGRASTSIQLAAARLAQAQALVRAADASRWPVATLNAGWSRQGGPLINAAGDQGTLFTTSANLSYELDLFGRISQGAKAANLDAESRNALLQSTRLLVQANVAQTYLNLRALDAERALVRGTLGAYTDTLRITESRFEKGLVAELDVVRARAELAATESDLRDLDRRRAETEHALAVLVGEVASSFTLGESDWKTALPVIPAGVPSTVLTRRPDVAAAQRGLQAAQARVGLAKLAWFPSFSLTASTGFASPQLSDLFTAVSHAWSLGALLAAPLFDGGRREAGVQNATAEFDAALASYREQILVAFREVEDQLSGLRLLAQQSDAQARAVAAASRATVLSESRYRSGLASQLDLLDAQRTELRNRRQALQVRAAQYQATVGLVRALGGAWDTRAPERAPLANQCDGCSKPSHAAS
jgi:multidrug efflux system outer membrane protein